MSRAQCLAAMVGLLATSIGVHAQVVNQCTSLASTLKEYNISSQSSAFLNSTYDKYCEQSGEAKGTSAGIGLDTVVKTIPVKFTGNYSDTKEGFKNFCKSYSSVVNSSDRRDNYDERIASKALDTIDACLRILSTGAFVTHELTNATTISFYLQSGPATKLELRGLFANPTDGIKCEGHVGGVLKAISQSSNIPVSGTQGVVCSRIPKKDAKGKLIYEEQVVTLSTNLYNYPVVMRRDERLPQDLAQEISTRLGQLATDSSQSMATAKYHEILFAQERTALKYSIIKQSENCPPGWKPHGQLAWHLADGPDYPANSLGDAGVAFPGWRWTHPKLCSRL